MMHQKNCRIITNPFSGMWGKRNLDITITGSGVTNPIHPTPSKAEFLFGLLTLDLTGGLTWS